MKTGNTSLVRTRLPTNYPGPRTNRESIASVVASCHTSSRHKQRAHILPRQVADMARCTPPPMPALISTLHGCPALPGARHMS